MNRSQKQNFVKLAHEILSDNQMCIFVNYKGLNAMDMVKLRRSLKDRQANFKIIKNTLFKKAVENTEFSYLSDFFNDQIAVSYSQDPVSLSNIVSNFAKVNNKVRIQIATLDGKKVDIETVGTLASLGSLDDVRARFIGVLRAPGSQLARVLTAYKEKLEA